MGWKEWDERAMRVPLPHDGKPANWWRRALLLVVFVLSIVAGGWLASMFKP